MLIVGIITIGVIVSKLYNHILSKSQTIIYQGIATDLFNHIVHYKRNPSTRKL